ALLIRKSDIVPDDNWAGPCGPVARGKRSKRFRIRGPCAGSEICGSRSMAERVGRSSLLAAARQSGAPENVRARADAEPARPPNGVSTKTAVPRGGSEEMPPQLRRQSPKLAES